MRNCNVYVHSALAYNSNGGCIISIGYTRSQLWVEAVSTEVFRAGASGSERVIIDVAKIISLTLSKQLLASHSSR